VGFTCPSGNGAYHLLLTEMLTVLSQTESAECAGKRSRDMLNLKKKWRVASLVLCFFLSTMSLQQAARKRLDDLLGNLRLHLDAYPDPSSEEKDWEVWGQQWCLKDVSVDVFVTSTSG
jgi:hypothetical protein